MKIISITNDTIHKEHICCCLSDQKSESGVRLKKEWLSNRLLEGLMFKRLDQRGKVFIEYLPAEKAWVPIHAPGYMIINCHWVAGRYKGEGWGKKLLEECEKDAKDLHGIVIISSSKKKPYLSDKKFLIKQGFEVCDTAPPYFELLVKRFCPTSPMPHFHDNAKTLRVGFGPGLDIYYTAQCPFSINYAQEALLLSQDSCLPIRVHQLTTKEEAQNHSCPVTTYSAFLNGQFITHEILNQAKILTLLSNQ
ncbi:YoaP domain-containing protein [Pelosinus propionicus]|uniref:YoaP-like n=1 Tax=Pelosinus propionicus DSM 13327 TaxID=1123291 RepID=A0A1I4NBA2_9FIRM|nr:YoaP domain-containing protein [Pelosinus propionicus]SFM12587.1 YoaP-like [Pelosinus propionicus DSM 13327]